MAAMRMFLAFGALALAQGQSITGRHTGTEAQAKKSSGGGGTSQACTACTDANGGKAKLRSLTLRYLATNIGGTNNAQGSMGSKWGFSGSDLPQTVTVDVADKDRRTIGSFTVSQGETFTIAPAKFESITYFSYRGTSSNVFIHTSCSQPLRVNDQFGSLQAVDFENDGNLNGASCQPCVPGEHTYRQRRQVWTYPPAWDYGSPSTPPSYVPPPPYGNPPATAPPATAPPSPPSPPCDCDNFDERPNVVEFVLTTGPAVLPGAESLQEGKGGATGQPVPAQNCAGMQVECWDDKGSRNDLDDRFFFGFVAIGERIPVQTNQATETRCELMGCGVTQDIQIHTSCSKRLATGDQFGALTVFDFPGMCPGSSPSGPQCPPPCYESLDQCPKCQMCPGPNKDFKPSVLSIRYLPGSTVITNNQEGKASVSGVSSGSSATVVCSDVGFTGTVGGGQTFQIPNVREGGSDLECSVSSGGQTQNIVLHVSCSKVLSVGDIFGSFEITGFILEDKKNPQFTVSSADPGACPACELCCIDGDMTVPDSVTVPAGSPLENQQRLDMWVKSAVCIEQGTGNHLPISATQALLNGDDTCVVASEVTFTCKDDCGTVHQETRIFKVVDKTPPVIVIPPTDLTVECSSGQVPSAEIEAWLNQQWKAVDAGQSAVACSYGSNVYVQSGPPPPPAGYSSGGYPGQYSTSSGSTSQSAGSYSQTGYGQSAGNQYFRAAPPAEDDGAQGRDDYSSGSSIQCSYCQYATYSPVCADGVQYDNACQAKCRGHTVVSPGPCYTGVQSAYSGSASSGNVYTAGGSYQNSGCHCSGNYAPVCSKSGVQFDSTCDAHCAGEFNFYHGACSTIPYITQVTQTYDPCGHCGNVQAPCCGSNGVQYDSPCHARCHGITDFHYGQCTVYAPSTNCGKTITYTHSQIQWGACSQNPDYQSAYSQYGNINGNLQCGKAQFTATDVCGNSVSTYANIFTADTQAPVISGGEDLEWLCDEDCAAYSIWENDAQAMLQRWVSGKACLSATDCSEISWSVHGVPYGNLCGKTGQVQFIATDKYGNVASKNKTYSFPKKPAYTSEPCYVCGQRVMGQKVKAALLSLELRYTGPATTVSANVEPNTIANVQSGQVIRFFAGNANRLEEVQMRSGKGSGSGASNKFPTNTEFTLSNGLSVTLHTSCSQPISTGDILSFSNGATLEIVGFTTDQGSSDQCAPPQCVPYTGPGQYAGPGQACPTCSYPAICGVPAPAYPAPPPSPPYVPPPAPTPCSQAPKSLCDGLYGNKPTEVRFQLVSGAPAMTHYQNGNADYLLHPSSGPQCPANQLFTVQCTGGTTQTVPAGGQYIWTGLNSYTSYDSRFESNSVCQIHGPGFFQRIRIHMSCKERLYTGDQFGNLVIVGFTLPDGTRVDQTQCPAGPYIPPYTAPTAPPYSMPGYGNNPTQPYVPPPPTYEPTDPPTYPPVEPPTNAHYNNCYQYMEQVTDYSSFYLALQSTHVNVALGQPGPYTVFAPVNEAWTNYAANLPALFGDIGQLSSLVLHHVIHGSYQPDQLVHGMTLVTFNGPCTVERYGDYISLVSSSGTVKSNVVGPGYQTQNGWVYGVNTILASGGHYYPNQNPPTTSAPVYVPVTNAPTVYAPPIGNNPTCDDPSNACSLNGRLVTLTFKYVGFNAVNHQQDGWTAGYVQEVANVPGTYDLPQVVKIKINGKNEASTANGWKFSLAQGEEFTLLGTAFGGVLEKVYVIKVNGRKIKFKANCGEPIGLGDQFGALVVTGFESAAGSVCVATDAGASSADASTGFATNSNTASPKLSGTEIAAIIVGCVAAVALIAGTIYIKLNSNKGHMSTHD